MSRRLPYGLEIARDQLLGRSNLASIVHKFGRAPALGTAMVTIWSQNALLTYLAAAQVLKVSSSDVKDAHPSGVGVRTVRVFGLDDDYLEVSEDIEMNGQTAVNTTVEFLRVFRIEALTAGSELDNAGTIYVGDGVISSGVPATKYATIEPGMNQSQLGFYTIPAGQSGFIHRAYLGVGTGRSIQGGVFAREVGGIFRVQSNYDVFQTPFRDELDFPLGFLEKTDLELRGAVDSSTIAAAGAMEIELISNSGL